MTVRRFTALGLAAVMLHLNAARADAACAAHAMPDGQHSSSMRHDMDGMEMHHDANVSDGVADHADCETPSEQDCCQAMTSCSPVLGFGVDVLVISWAPAHDAAGLLLSTLPASRLTAPEPPPPRL